jgi:hypothetical protein
MGNEQKYKVISGYLYPQFDLDKIITANDVVNHYVELGFLIPVETKKVYRWKFNDVILIPNRINTDWRWGNKSTLIHGIIDETTFNECLAAGLIIESEEVVEPELSITYGYQDKDNMEPKPEIPLIEGHRYRCSIHNSEDLNIEDGTIREFTYFYWIDTFLEIDSFVFLWEKTFFHPSRIKEVLEDLTESEQP